MRSSRRNDSAKAAPQSDTSRTDVRRRGFLIALGAGTAGAAALAARSLSGVAPVAEGSTEIASSQGYRATEHVKRYYQTAKT